MSLAITPETKVGELLDAYPEVEKQLVEWVPAFSKLKNPILRRTVAKVATLDQAAKVGGIGVQELVRRLRQATGQPEPEVAPFAIAGQPAQAGPPSWLDESCVRWTIDADTMLETGEHPIGKVRQCVANSKPGEIVKLTSSFRPAPLIDNFVRTGAAVYLTESEPGRYATYICARPL